MLRKNSFTAPGAPSCSVPAQCRRVTAGTSRCAMTGRVVKQYEQGVLFRLGRVLGPRLPGCG